MGVAPEPMESAGLRRFGLRMVAVAVLFLIPAGTSPQSSRPVQSDDSILNQRAPDFTRNDLAGRRIHLADLRGHVVLLNFWATWCAPCQMETPRFIAWQSKYGRIGLQMIGVSMDDEDAPVRVFQRRFQVNYPLIMGDERLGLLYGGVLGLPLTYVIDRNGIVRMRLEGEPDLDELESALRKMLAAPSSASGVTRAASW